MKTPDVAIIGAGIGGLAAALALTRVGFRPRVYEQAPELGEVGAGLSLSPNAVKGLRFLGIESELMAASDIPPHQITRHYKTGEVLVDIDRADTPQRYGAPYLQIHRADLHALLATSLERLVADSIVLDKELREVRESTGCVSAVFSDGSKFETDVLIGADGLRSRIRRQIFREDDPQFSGFVAWRGVVPGNAIAHLGFPPGSCVYAGPARLFVRYPVRHGALENFVAFTRSETWEAESWSQTGDTRELAEMFADFVPDVGELIAAVPGATCHKWGLYEREPIPSWATDRVAVLGDAAHPMLPWFGQGAAAAIEDAVVLARAFSLAGSSKEALQRYQKARVDRVTLIHRESLLGGERLSTLSTAALRNQPPRTEDSLGITEYDPATVDV